MSSENTAPSATDLSLVRDSFDRVVPIAGVAADLFYDRLFYLAPSLRRLFPTDMRDQKRDQDSEPRQPERPPRESLHPGELSGRQQGRRRQCDQGQRAEGRSKYTSLHELPPHAFGAGLMAIPVGNRSRENIFAGKPVRQQPG